MFRKIREMGNLETTHTQLPDSGKMVCGFPTIQQNKSVWTIYNTSRSDEPSAANVARHMTSPLGRCFTFDQTANGRRGRIQPGRMEGESCRLCVRYVYGGYRFCDICRLFVFVKQSGYIGKTGHASLRSIEQRRFLG